MSRKRLTMLAASVVTLSFLGIVFGQVASNAKPAARKASVKAAVSAKAPIDVLGAAGPNAVVAVINGEKVTKKQLMDLLWGNQANYILDKAMINNVLIAQKAKKAGITVSDAEIQAKVKEIEKNIPGGKKVGQALAEMGISRAAWTETSIKPQILVDKIIAKSIVVSPADIAEFRLARHILISTQPGQGEDQAKKDAEAKAKIESIAAEIKAGKDFAAAADEYTKDPSNTDPQTGKGKGGMLDWFKHGRMMKEFEDAVYALKPGEVSAPVKTSYGYHLIKLEKVGADATPAEKEQIKKLVADEKKSTMQRGFWSDLRTGAKIKNNLIIPSKEVVAKPPMNPRAPSMAAPRPTAPRPATPAPAPPKPTTPPSE